MKIKLSFILIGAGILTVLHLGALYVGFYEGKVWVDMPLHFLGGVLLGLVGLWIFEKAFHDVSIQRTSLLIAIVVVATSLFGSFLWEIFEFFLRDRAPMIALPLKLYSPTVSDTLSDMFLGTIGGLAVALLSFTKTFN